jgi:LysR family transcriptional regulator, glycine cleavage system transcriptional activator
VCLKWRMAKRLPPIESLRILEACVRHESFTRAAREIGVTPAAVSLRMKNLEAALGVKLFSRSGPHLAPTRAARKLAARVAEALKLVELGVEECREAMPPLRLTVVPSFATYWLAPRLERYHRSAGAAPLQLDASMEVRASEEFDVAIRTGTGQWPGFDAMPLIPIEVTPMLSPGLASRLGLTSPADLVRAPLLRHDDWPRWFHEAGVGRARLHYCETEYPTYELDAAAAVAGTGVALLSPVLFGSLIEEKKLIQPFPHVMQGPDWHYLLRKNGDERPAVQRLRAWLQVESQRGGA